ncbi:MAG: hypothetical protein IPG76_00270 [Acidobacteria bacterium]|nr:hypothetical protein [Acidobacteriota bacterium]
MIESSNSDPGGLFTDELGRCELTDLPKMLRIIVETVGAYGCILWQVERRISLPESQPNLKLFVLSQWFPDGQLAELHDLPLDRSVTGLVTLEATMY